MYLRILVAFLFLCCNCSIFGQKIELERTVLSSGNLKTEALDRLNITSTIGELFINNSESEIISLNEGFHRGGTLKVSEGNSISEIGVEINVAIFPNPTVDELNLKIRSSNEFERFQGGIFDMWGREVLRLGNEGYLITDQPYKIDFSLYHAGCYILRIYSEDGANYKDFRIVKAI